MIVVIDKSLKRNIQSRESDSKGLLFNELTNKRPAVMGEFAMAQWTTGPDGKRTQSVIHPPSGYTQDGTLVYENCTGTVSHRGYLTYLERCWERHLGAVFSPDILWYTLLCELAGVVKANPESYRHLFTDSPEKKNILIFGGEVMPVDQLVVALSRLVPTDISLFLPEFTTSGDRERLARYTAFADAASPYYNYLTLACGIPFVDVRGTIDDYLEIKSKWLALSELFEPAALYFKRVFEVVCRIVDGSQDDDKEFWGSMFKLTPCGSGSQVTVKGWFAELYNTRPVVAYPENFPPHLASIEYVQLETLRKFRMYNGLLTSSVLDDTLVPEFGAAVFDIGSAQ